MRRAVMFAPGFAEFGGAGRQSQLVARGLVDRGWQVRVITRAGTLSRFLLERESGITVLEVPGFNRQLPGAVLYLLCAIVVGLVWGARATAFMSVQLYSPTTAAAFCSLILRRPFIAWTVNSGPFSEADFVRGSRLAPLRLWLLGRARALVGQTPAAAEELAGLVPPERVRIIPTPVKPVAASELNGEPRVVFTGRLAEEKDLPTLLTAWRGVAARHSAAELWLVGEGGDYRSVEAEVREIVAGDEVLSASVSFTGWVSDVGEYLERSDVYVLPSLIEGMSNSLVEACAWRRVVVASDIESNRTVLGEDYPLLFAAGDAGQLELKLEAALFDPELRAEAVRQVVARLDSFSLDNVVGSFEALLEA